MKTKQKQKQQQQKKKSLICTNAEQAYKLKQSSATRGFLLAVHSKVVDLVLFLQRPSPRGCALYVMFVIIWHIIYI